MKILFLLSQLKKQGPNTQFLYLAEELIKHSVEITVLTYKKYDEDSSLAILFKNYGIEVISYEHLSRYAFIKSFSKISACFDYVCSYGLESDFYNAIFSSSRKISFVRNQLFYSYASVYGTLGYVLAGINYLLFKNMDVVFSCSLAVQSYLKRFYLDSNYLTNTINSGVFNDLIGSSFGVLDGETTRYKKPLDIDSNNVFITISSKLGGKNTDFLLKSFSRVELRQHTLIVLGYMTDETIAQYVSYTNIKFLGFKPNIYDYFKVADYFVSASYHEGLPNAVLEALYFGIPCLLSDIPEHLEILGKCSSSKVGYSFQNNNINSFELNLNKIIDLNMKECSSAAQTLVKNKFNTADTAVKFLEVVSDKI
jgi:glycosyltransferase involved in cell wall biosynthesis